MIGKGITAANLPGLPLLTAQGRLLVYLATCGDLVGSCDLQGVNVGVALLVRQCMYCKERTLMSCSQVKDLGAHVLVDMTNEAERANYMGDNGFDVIINCASASVDTGVLLSMLRNDGTLIQASTPRN